MHSRAESYLRSAVATIVMVASLYLCGCHETVQVFGPSVLPKISAPTNDKNRSNTTDFPAAAAKNKLPGIPFFNHMGICIQEEEWNEPQTTLTLTVTPDNGLSQTRSMVLNNQPFYQHDPDVLNLLTILEIAQGKHKITDKDQSYCPANVAKGWDTLGQKYEVKQIDETGSDPSTDPNKISIESATKYGILVLTANTATQGVGVDYSRVYYLNTKSPLIGTASVDAKIGTDGTLTEGSVSVDDETGNYVLTALGTVATAGGAAISTILAAKIAAAATIAAAASAAPATSPLVAQEESNSNKQPGGCAAGGGFDAITTKTVTYKFDASVGGYKHVHKLVTPLISPADPAVNFACVATSGTLSAGSYTVTPLSDTTKPDKNAIGVSGTITLPKPADSPTPKP
jgi:hypothetical protein